MFDCYTKLHLRGSGDFEPIITASPGKFKGNSRHVNLPNQNFDNLVKTHRYCRLRRSPLALLNTEEKRGKMFRKRLEEAGCISWM